MTPAALILAALILAGGGPPAHWGDNQNAGWVAWGPAVVLLAAPLLGNLWSWKWRKA